MSNSMLRFELIKREKLSVLFDKLHDKVDFERLQFSNLQATVRFHNEPTLQWSFGVGISESEFNCCISDSRQNA